MYQTHSGTGTLGKLSRHMGGKSLVAALVVACLLMVASRGPRHNQQGRCAGPCM